MSVPIKFAICCMNTHIQIPKVWFVSELPLLKYGTEFFPGIVFLLVHAVWYKIYLLPKFRENPPITLSLILVVNEQTNTDEYSKTLLLPVTSCTPRLDSVWKHCRFWHYIDCMCVCWPITCFLFLFIIFSFLIYSSFIFSAEKMPVPFLGWMS